MATFRMSGILLDPPNGRKSQNIVCNMMANTKFGAKLKVKKLYKEKYPQSTLKVRKAEKIA